MDEYQVYSNTINQVGDGEITLWSIWRDTVLVGVAPLGGVPVKRWLKQGEIVEIGGRRWVLLDIRRATEVNEADLMLHLVAVV